MAIPPRADLRHLGAATVLPAKHDACFAATDFTWQVSAPVVPFAATSAPPKSCSSRSVGKLCMRLKLCLGMIAIIAGSAAPASAHHVMGGSAPQSLFEGLLSGLAHPVIGMDHLAFVIALGLAAAFMSEGPKLVVLFVLATIAGVLSRGMVAAVPHLELLVSLSIVLLGIGFAAKQLGRSHVWWTFAIAAGLLHGFAYGESIAASPPIAVASYLAGLAMAQVMLALMAKTFVELMRVDQVPTLGGARVVGGILVAIGMAFATTSFFPV